MLTPSAPSEGSAQLPAAWSAQEINEARARCTALLKGLDLVAVPAEPIREGAACGSPAPMKLVSIGSSPPVAFSPQATLTCDMIAALHRWVQGDVQPLARKHLGAPVVNVSVMSSFSCRNAYGRAHGKLSEHGRVNAVDIGSFLTAEGQTTQVVADWGASRREITDKAIAVQAEEVKRQAEAAAAARKAKRTPDEPRIAAPSGGKAFQAGTISIGIPGLSVGPASDLPTGALGWTAPSHLGGPKDKRNEVAAAAPASSKAVFLREIHKAACKIFTTVIGPDANKAHRNHFHLDLAERTTPNYCE